MMRFRKRIVNDLEKGTCAPNNHEQAFVQRDETADNIKMMFGVRRGLVSKQGVPNTIKTAFENVLRGRINNFGRQLVPQFDNAGRKSKLAACQIGQLMALF